ncbi:transporter substrate-binding domain-containing protein [Aureimonas phyllosphaerae]|uniref:Polar amino acid transport system substrate-binding protein n=1 Tax=Aureimonas phyllosphaerae TaxID=1166078 RepID=A0A7W6FWE1_9HYPH|nr:transporter substrate-binding domain-containing protein [Aureimonas phyllosphaerae]MBB3938264.1 polar amino acid transport system substrate-binding protein [Aureimonas phyllosphaerae]MBB3962271.1 polar amino acid transport system substrate-binding protein [Aureimonas phyllosphaerae]SFF59063.1 amino acid ABC transporter substrate-binding protein, PAAT family [Aureimonas phyllosphaerae]
MSTRMLAAASVAAFLAATFAAQAGATLDRVTKSGEMNVATNSGWPPQSFLNDSNELVGFDVDVANEIGKRLGATVTFATPEWQVLTGGHWNGRFDLAVGSVTPTKARAQVIDFPAIYYYSPYVFAVHKDSKAQSRADLNGKVIGVETGTTSEDYIRGQLQIDAPDLAPVQYDVKPGEVRTYANSMLPFDDLRLGDGLRVDAVIAPEQTVLQAIKSNYPLKIVPGDYAFREPLVVVADKGDPEWTKKVGDIVGEMKKDGTLSALTTKWYGKDYSAD